MKLLNTIKKLVEESKKIYEEACDKGVPDKELERLEKNYQQSLRLMKMIDKKNSSK